MKWSYFAGIAWVNPIILEYEEIPINRKFVLIELYNYILTKKIWSAYHKCYLCGQIRELGITPL